MKKKPLIILTGPTAAGKTALSIKLAKEINGEIISADSMQVYKRMNIGTAKITPEEMKGIKHYLVDELEPEEEFNIVKFKKYASGYVEQIYEKGKIPIVVGGTGFYIQALLYDIQFEENVKETLYRKELEELAKRDGSASLHDMLRKIDESSANAIHANNTKRVIRALEYYKQTGKPISEHNATEHKRNSPYHFIYFVLNDDRNILYDRINSRVDAMIEHGLVEEVQGLSKQGYTKNLVSMQGLGYKEILSYLEGNCTLEEAVSILKRDTRHFAKRQLTWFRREKEVTWINKKDFGNQDTLILQALLDKIKEM